MQVYFLKSIKFKFGAHQLGCRIVERLGVHDAFGQSGGADDLDISSAPSVILAHFPGLIAIVRMYRYAILRMLPGIFKRESPAAAA